MTVWQETHRRGADRSISDWMASRTPIAGELMAILQERDPSNAWTTCVALSAASHHDESMHNETL